MNYETSIGLKPYRTHKLKKGCRCRPCGIKRNNGHKFTQEKAVNGPWTDWQRPVMSNYHLACCDCGLVHTLNFRVLKIIKWHKNGDRTGEILPKDKYQIEFKIRRNTKYTKELRQDPKKQ